MTFKEKTRRRKHPTIQGDDLLKHLISTFRRFSDLAGPSDRLQTREFRTTCEQVKLIEGWLDTPLSCNEDGSKKAIAKALDERYDRKTLLNYILYHWPLHVYEGMSLISELPFVPKRVLDVGSGSGSYGFSALLHGADDVTLFDASRLSLDIAGDIFGRWGFTVKTEEGIWPKRHLPQIADPYDLIIIGHSIQELSSGSQDIAMSLIENALSVLSKSGFLIITLTSHELQNKTLLQLRNAIRAKGYEIQAPCIWQGECPALKMGNKSPCYAQRRWEKPRIMQEIQRGADIFLHSLKMSYLIIRSPLMKKRELMTTPLYRVISPPVEIVGKKRYFLCGTEGKKHIGLRLSHNENVDLPKELKAFQFIERGSVITFQRALEKKEAVDLDVTSTIDLIAPNNRVVPELALEKNVVSND